MNDRSLKLTSLLNLFHAPSAPADFEAQFCLALAAFFEAEYASIFLVDPRRKTLRFHCAPNLPHQVMGRFEFKLGEGVCGAAALQRQTIAVANTRECSFHAAAVDEASGLATRSLLASPICKDGQCLGVLEIGNRKQGVFNEDEKCLLQLIAELYARHFSENVRLAAPHRASPPETNPASPPDDPVIVGFSPAIERVLRLTLRVSQTDLPVLILGETGTGKELVARRLHLASRRVHLPLICINCAALSENILESELFGHVRGAFTGADRNRCGRLEEAHGGTIFLDEVGDMSPACQAKLLRALEYGEIVPVGGNEVRKIDVRILSATNQKLPERIECGQFRVDLYYRLCGMVINVPPLRERPEDIEPLARHFLDRLCQAEKHGPAGFSAEAMDLLRAHPWPGNVRELKRIVESAFMLADGEWITSADLPDLAGARLVLTRPPGGAPDAGSRERNNPESGAGNAQECQRIREALAVTAYRGSGRWNIAGAAAQLGIPRKTLDYKIKRVYRLDQAGSNPDEHPSK